MVVCITFETVAACRVDPFTKKDWYDVKAPAVFTVRNIGKTLVTRTQGKSKWDVRKISFDIHSITLDIRTGK